MKQSLLILLMFNVFPLFFQLNGATAQEKPTVFVSVLPQKFFIEKLCKDAINVEVMVAPGASPATYEPKSSQMKKLSHTTAYFAIGVPFEEAWLSRISGVNREMKIIHTDEKIPKIAMAQDHLEVTKEVGHGDGHHHGSLDPHIWLSPALVKIQVAMMSKILQEILPEKKDLVVKNTEEFLLEIDQLNVELHAILDEKIGTKFMVFHPSWGYFSHDYGLEQVAIELEGKSPKPAQLKDLIEFARGHDIKVIFAQPQFSRKHAQVIAREIHGEVLLIDPLAEDWLTNMRSVASKLKSALK